MLLVGGNAKEFNIDGVDIAAGIVEDEDVVST